MKKPSKLTVILYGVAAAAWTVSAVLAVAFREYETSVFLFGMNILCAAIWIAAFIAWLIRYRSDKSE